jgi:thioredoxin 2
MFSQSPINTGNSIVIACVNCGANNRVNTNKSLHKFQAVCGRCQHSLQSSTKFTSSAHPIIVADSNFSKIIEKSPLPVLLDLWAPWCGPCRTLTPLIEDLATELAGKVNVAKLNVDENPITPTRFGIRSIPTLLIFKNGQIVDRIVGAHPKQDIISKLNSILK